MKRLKEVDKPVDKPEKHTEAGEAAADQPDVKPAQ